MPHSHETTPTYALMPHGRIMRTGAGWQWEYHLRDHLGNTRLTIADTAGRGVAVVLQNTHYYPFGMSIATLSHTTAGHANPWLYNGKEHQPDFDLGWYDYGARYYDAEVGRFHTVDPLAQEYRFQSPYAYAANNPIRFIDWNGENPVLPAAGAVLGTINAAASAVLLAGGVVITGYIIYDAIKRQNPGLKEQEKRERASQRETSDILRIYNQSVSNSFPTPSPEGDVESGPEGGGKGKVVQKVLCATGMAAVLGEGTYKLIKEGQDPNGAPVRITEDGNANSNEIIDVDATNENGVKKSGTSPVKMPSTSEMAPQDKTRYDQTIPIEYEDN